MPISVVDEQLAGGELQPWYADNSTAITRVYEQWGLRICEIVVAGGEMTELVDLKNERIEPFARTMSCDRMLIPCRKGWQKVLTDYKLANIVLMKELD